MIVRRRLNSPASRMPETGMTVAIVTDHAVLRYIQREHDVDIEAIRQAIGEICATGVRLGATGVVSGKGKFILKDGRVVTFLDSHMRSGDLTSEVEAE